MIALASVATLLATGGLTALHHSQSTGEPPLSWAIGIDGEPALGVYTDADLAVLLEAYPRMPIAQGVRSDHHGYYWITPGIRCGDDQYGRIRRSPSFVLIDSYLSRHDVEIRQAAGRRERTSGYSNGESSVPISPVVADTFRPSPELMKRV